MINDFFKKLTPILNDEKADYQKICGKLLSKESCVNLMPCVTFDLWPVFALQCTEASEHIHCHGRSMIYIAPIGEHDFYFKPSLESKVSDFYKSDEDGLELLYGAKLDEMLLLKSDEIAHTFDLGAEYQGANVIYMSFIMPNGSEAYVFFMLETMLNTWRSVFEKNSVSCEVLIDSHKGMGDWFDTTELYSHFKSAKKTDSLPAYYFKGKYISHPAPDGFLFLHSVSQSGKNDCTSELYRTDYHKA